MMKMNWKHRKGTKKIVITLIIEEADFFIARFTRLKKSQSISEKLKILMDMAHFAELSRELNVCQDKIITTEKMRERVNNI